MTETLRTIEAKPTHYIDGAGNLYVLREGQSVDEFLADIADDPNVLQPVPFQEALTLTGDQSENSSPSREPS